MPCLFFPLDLVLQPAKEPPSPHLLRQSEGRRRPHQNPLSRDSHARGACPPPRCSQLGPWVLVGPVQRALKPILETPRLGFAVHPAPRPAELRLGSVYGTSSWSLEEWVETGWQPGRQPLWTILPVRYLRSTLSVHARPWKQVCQSHDPLADPRFGAPGNGDKSSPAARNPQDVVGAISAHGHVPRVKSIRSWSAARLFCSARRLFHITFLGCSDASRWPFRVQVEEIHQRKSLSSRSRLRTSSTRPASGTLFSPCFFPSPLVCSPI
jgi:hypothetical protein